MPVFTLEPVSQAKRAQRVEIKDENFLRFGRKLNLHPGSLRAAILPASFTESSRIIL